MEKTFHFDFEGTAGACLRPVNPPVRPWTALALSLAAALVAPAAMFGLGLLGNLFGESNATMISTLALIPSIGVMLGGLYGAHGLIVRLCVPDAVPGAAYDYVRFRRMLDVTEGVGFLLAAAAACGLAAYYGSLVFVVQDPYLLARLPLFAMVLAIAGGMTALMGVVHLFGSDGKTVRRMV